jgi:hypothetical protein
VLNGSRQLSPAGKVRLAGEVLRTYARVRVLLRRTDLKAALASLRAERTTEPVAEGDRLIASDRLARAVLGTLPKLPVNDSCLMRSLTLSGLLARRGIDGVLVIGVEPGTEFGAHAWVEVDGRALLEPGGERFARLVDL